MTLTLQQKAELIREECLHCTQKDPIAAAQQLMRLPEIAMHGPEHHILDGAALLCALHNAGCLPDLEPALDTLIGRGLLMPGASCGWWGVCHSASSVGAALAILRGTGPLSDNEYYRDNLRLTSSALSRIAEIGGPRCCKRNAFLSLLTAVEYLRERCGIELPCTGAECAFFPQNAECLHSACPFYPR